MFLRGARDFVTIGLIMGVLSVPIAPAGAQETTVGPRSVGGLTFVDEIQLTVVNVVVHVTDKSGKVVTDLTRDDFRISQDGDPKPITNFHLYTEDMYRSYMDPVLRELDPVAPSDTAGEADASLDPRPVYIVVYIDNQNIHPMERNRALSQMRTFVRDNLRPPVQMMVVAYQRSFEILQPFTSNPREILDAFREVRTWSGGRVARDTDRDEILDLMQRQQEEAGSTGAAARQTREYSTIMARVLAFADEENTDLAFSIQALRDTINVVAGLPGEKSIFYVSNGLPMIAGLSLISAVSTTYNDHSVLNHIGRYDRTNLYDSLVEVANTQDVTIYSLGVGGLDIDSMSSADVRSAKDPHAASIGAENYLDSMRYLARGTGGLAVLNTNDISLGLERIRSTLLCYYSLGYTLNSSGVDKVHRIKVELPNHPQYHLEYRRRVVEKSHQSQVRDKVLTGLMFDLDQNPMGLDMVFKSPGTAAGERWLVPVRMSFDLSTVALLPQGEDYVGHVTLYLAARERDGKSSELVRQEHEIRVPMGEYEEALRSRFTITARLLMEDGSYRVSVGLMDQLTRQASYRTFATSVGER